MSRPPDRQDVRCVTVTVPFAIRKRGGKKLVITPDGAHAAVPATPRIENSLIKILARAHRWNRLLESGAYGSLTELANAEKINRSYLCRVLRLTLLAPDVVEAIVAGRQPQELTLDVLMKPLTVEWERQRLNAPSCR